jgi:hypothetical protein
MATNPQDPKRRLDFGVRMPDINVRSHARLKFLDAIDRVEPEVRQSLYKIDVDRMVETWRNIVAHEGVDLRSCQTFFQGQFARVANPDACAAFAYYSPDDCGRQQFDRGELVSVTLTTCPVDAVQMTRARALDIELGVWAERWNLAAPWLLGYARETLQDGCAGLRANAWSDDPSDAPGWFEGDSPAALGRKDRLKEPKHFDWLARHVVKREPFALIQRNIAPWGGVSESGALPTMVRDACRSLANLIDLPIEDNRGRPRKPRP